MKLAKADRTGRPLRSGYGKRRAAAALAVFVISLLAAGAAMAAPAASPAPRLGSMQTVKQVIVFLMTLLQGVGICFMAFGVIALALSFQSHDDSQRSKAVLSIVGGAVAACAKFVVVYIAPQATQWVT